MIMDGLGKRVSGYPKATIVAIVMITLIAIGSIQIFGIEQEFSEESFMPDMEIVKASNEISEDYTATYSVSILVKSKNGDVLTSDALVEMLQIEKAIINDSKIMPTLENTNPEMLPTNVNSVADIIAQMALAQNIPNPTMEQKIFAIQSMSDFDIKQLIGEILSSNQTPPMIKGMFSMMLTKDFDPAKGEFKAKGTIIMVNLNASMASGDSHMMGGSGISEPEQRMDEIVKSTKLESTTMTVMGMSIISDEIMDANTESMAILLPLAFVLVIIILAIIYRNGLDMLFSLLALGFAIIWVYGFGSAMGYTFNPMTTAVPVLIVGLGIDYGIHITMRYREEIKSGKKVEETVGITINSVGMALLLATITTVVAFLSNLASPIGLLGEFGVLSAVGIIGSFVTMITFVPACKQLKDIRKLKKGKPLVKNANNNISGKKNAKIKGVGVAVLNKTVSGVAVAAGRHPIPVLIVVIIITIGAGGMALHLKTTFDFEDFLPEDLEISKDLEFMMNEFEITAGEGEEVNILVKGDITDPQLLRDIGKTTENIKDDESVIKNKYTGEPDIQSIVSFMKDWATNTTQYGMQDSNFDPSFKALYNNTMTLEDVPKQDATKENITALYDWLYSHSESTKDVQYVLHRTDNNDYDGTVLRISVDVDVNDNEAIETLRNDLEEDKKPLDNSADKSMVTGGPILTKVIMDSLNDSQIRSLIITIIMSLIVLTIVFWYKWRSLILGMITLTPVIFCVVWTLGTMYIIGWSLNVMTIMITSLTIGLGITYGIHVTHRFLEDLERYKTKNNITHLRVRCPDCRHTVSCSGKPGEVVKVTCPKCGAIGKVTFKKSTSTTYIDDACLSTATNTGTALFGAAATTIAGFGLLVFALMPPLQQFGGITALTILYSFLASTFALPALLVIWAKWRQKHKK